MALFGFAEFSISREVQGQYRANPVKVTTRNQICRGNEIVMDGSSSPEARPENQDTCTDSINMSLCA